MDQKSYYNEKEEIKKVLKMFKELFKFSTLLNEIKPGSADSLDKLEKFINNVPAADVLSKALQENYTIAREFLDKARSLRAQEFKRHEAEYIRWIKEEGKQFREYSNGWRVGSLEIKTNPGISKIKILYNDETLINWSPVSSKDDFIKLEQKANNMLHAELIPKDQIVDVFWDAYHQVIYMYNKINKTNNSLVPIHEFYKEVRITLIRKYIESKKPNAKIDKYLNFPLWAFAYNLDVYRSMLKEVPENKRLSFQTGSLQETSQGKGLVINGLNPYDEYKVMCYVFAVKGV